MQRRQGLRIRIRAVIVTEQLVGNIARRCRVEAEEEPVKMNFGSTFAWTRALRIQESRTASRRCRNSVVENTAMNMNSGGRLPSATATAVSSNGACNARGHMTTWCVCLDPCIWPLHVQEAVQRAVLSAICFKDTNS